MLGAWSGIEFERDPIRQLQGVINSICIPIFTSNILLNFYIDLCIFFVTFQFFQPFGKFGISLTSINQRCCNKVVINIFND